MAESGLLTGREVVKKAEVVHKAPLGLRSVAIFELAKGLIGVAVCVLALLLLHKDPQEEALKMLHVLRIDPAWHYAQLMYEESSKVTDTRLLYASVFALVYALIRFAETYGLWHERPWAEWFAVISASLYLPVEVYHFCRHPTLPKACLFLGNVIIVLYLAHLLWVNRKKHEAMETQK